MKILLIGSTGHVGSAVHQALVATHDVVVASRASALSVDITNPESIAALYKKVGPIDAVVTTVGSAPFKEFTELTLADYQSGLTSKTLGQVEVVRQGVKQVRDGGSFTITTGVVGRGIIRTGAAAAMANGALEFFVPTAAAELPRHLRLNAVSPTVLVEAPGYHPSFPGYIPVPAATVAQAYVRSVDGIETGQVYKID